jgi:hypothetical protein
MIGEREALQARWLKLIRETLPQLAGPRSWPVRHDHCFARIILDQVCGGRWYDHVSGRPAYKHLSDVQLQAAVALAEDLVSGADLVALNETSLAWRKARRAGERSRSLGGGIPAGTG